MDRPLTVREAASALDYSTKQVYRLLRSGTLNGERIGSIWLIPRQEVERVKSLQGPGGRLPKPKKKVDNP